MSVILNTLNNIAYIDFDQEDSKVNLLTFEMLRRLDTILDEVHKDSSLKALVIQSKKKDVFIAGADIKEIEKIVEPADGQKKAQLGQLIFNKLEDLKIPTVCVIDGVALGGGCELALACLYRVATFNEKVKIGLPEVNLGFVPGFGGTYRLPRVVGLSQGLKMILSGRPVDSQKALRAGLVDRLFPQKGLREHLRGFVTDIIDGKIKKKKYSRKRKRGLTGWLESLRPGHGLIFHQSRRSVLKLTKGFYPAPLNAIDVVKKTFYLNRGAGLEIESRTFGELAVTRVSKNLVQVFYLSEKYKKLQPRGAEKIAAAEVDKCGVLGAGVMGGGIAQLLSSRDIWTRLKDVNYDAIAKGLGAAAKLYRQAVKKRKFTEAQAQVGMAHITGTLDYSGFRHLDFVIEAVVEKMEVKNKVFKELSKVTGPKTVLATNTSALSVTEMAKQTKDPSRVVGFHFFNPVHRMPLVEVITTPMTSTQAMVTALGLAKRLGKTPILVKDSCGFIVNRILLAYMSEAGRVLEECGHMEEIDRVVTDFGMPMGPFTLADEVGLDVGLKVMQILEDAFGERYRPVGIFNKFFEKGQLGKKTGVGFYIHRHKGRTANPEVAQWLSTQTLARFDEQNVLKRLIYVMINEAARCLQDGVVDEPSAIDAGMIFGTGFPPFRGGLLRYADKIGLDNIISQLEEFSSQFQAERFKPCPYLLDLKKMNRQFFN